MDRSRPNVFTQAFRKLALAATLAAVFAVAAAPAAAREARITVPTPAAEGPAELNKVWVDQYGPAKGKRVLVLMPGTAGGSGNFTLAARYLVKKIKGLQVWAIDRRSQALERPEVFQKALRGEVSLQGMFDHYLGWTSNGGTPADHYEFLVGGNHPYARRWGMKVALEDARAVVMKARAKGRRSVVLGGHSLGASLTAAYASWDFDGRPGYKDIDGMVLIDGGLMGSFDAFDAAQAQQQLDQLESGNPFLDLIGFGIPEIAGLFAEIGGIYALKAPTQEATTLQSYPLLPPQFNPPFPVTNRALFGRAFDRDTSPQSLSLLHINAGFVGAGTPGDWVDGGVTPVQRLAATFGQEPANGVEWFFPRRLTIDTNGADQLEQNAVANLLGLRLLHQRKVDDPFYAIQTDLTEGGVLLGARRFVARAKTTKKESTLVNADPEQAHLDPLMAAPKTNRFYRSVTKFLRKKVGWAAPKKKGKKRGKKRRGGR